MSLESDLKTFWESYQPVLQLVETASGATDIPELRQKMDLLQPTLITLPFWEIHYDHPQKWYDSLVLSEINLPCTGATNSLSLKPKYQEADDKVSWNSAERQQVSERDVSTDHYWDFSLYFKPEIKPKWKSAGERYAHDVVKLKSSVGEISASTEDGSGSFISVERGKFLAEEEAKPRIIVGEDGWPRERELLPARIIKVRLGYKTIEQGLSDEEMGKQMTQMYEGYTYVTSIQFRISDLGAGEVDRFLQHLGVKY